MACVEVVANNSEPDGKIYKELIGAWSKTGIKESYEEFISEISDSEKEAWKNNLKHPELAIKKDVNEPWQDLVNLFNKPDFENRISGQIGEKNKGESNYT